MGSVEIVTPVPRMAARALVTHLTPFLCPASRNASCNLLMPIAGDSLRIAASAFSASVLAPALEFLNAPRHAYNVHPAPSIRSCG